MQKNKTIYLIDGTAYIHRAYHAIAGLTNGRGFPTNAVFGFTRIILKLIKDFSPEYLAVFFDSKGPTFRHDIYKEYKSNRPLMPDDLSIQIPYIKDIVAAFNIPIFEMTGYEADDLIGTVSKKCFENDFYVVIVTGDKDFMQLINEKITMWDASKDKTINLEEVFKTYNIYPDNIIDFMALSGDSSDNIPGVRGIGPKTASELIKQYKTIEFLYENLHTITKKKVYENLSKSKDNAILSKTLVTIDVNVPIDIDIEKLKVQNPDNKKLYELFKWLDFKQLLTTLPKEENNVEKKYKLLTVKSDELEDLVSKLKSAKLFAINIETTSTNPMIAEIIGFSFAFKSDEAFYISCENADCILKKLKPILEGENIKKIGQNIKYNCIVLNRYGISLKGVIFDTMIGSYLINPSKKSKDNFCEDAVSIFIAYNETKQKLDELNLLDLFENIEMPLLKVLLTMELRGICVDSERLFSLSKDFSFKLEKLEYEIYSTAGEKFNINSHQQLGNILFDKLKLPTHKKTHKKTGFSTDVDVLNELSRHHILPDLILRHRTISKLKSTYVDSLIELKNSQTGRIHTCFNQTITATGRLSSNEPNLQNIPIRTEEGKEIRKSFIPQKDWHLISADYSQIELRILAHYSQDPILMKSFIKDEDVHNRTAEEVFQTFPSFVTQELRRHAKIINFGIIYGMSAYGLSQELGISQKMAKNYIENYFLRYNGVKKFIDTTIETARKTQQTSTLLGRIRLLPEINSKNNNIRQYAERIAINTPIQGTAADLLKIAMIRIEKELRSKNLRTAMLLSVHDELVFESPQEELDRAKKIIKKIMENVFELKVPLKVNIASGKNWEEAH